MPISASIVGPEIGKSNKDISALSANSEPFEPYPTSNLSYPSLIALEIAVSMSTKAISYKPEEPETNEPHVCTDGLGVSTSSASMN